MDLFLIVCTQRVPSPYGMIFHGKIAAIAVGMKTIISSTDLYSGHPIVVQGRQSKNFKPFAKKNSKTFTVGSYEKLIRLSHSLKSFNISKRYHSTYHIIAYIIPNTLYHELFRFDSLESIKGMNSILNLSLNKL